MKLKGLFLIEIVVLLGIAIFFISYFWFNPYLGSSEEYQSIPVYSQKSEPIRYLSLDQGSTAVLRFNYTSYDPSVIVLDLSIDSIEHPGKFDIFCNYKLVTTVNVTPETQRMTINLVSFSGLDWVEPMTAMFGLNDLVFESNEVGGYVGTLSYQITFRGSR